MTYEKPIDALVKQVGIIGVRVDGPERTVEVMNPLYCTYVPTMKPWFPQLVQLRHMLAVVNATRTAPEFEAREAEIRAIFTQANAIAVMHGGVCVSVLYYPNNAIVKSLKRSVMRIVQSEIKQR